MCIQLSHCSVLDVRALVPLGQTRGATTVSLQWVLNLYLLIGYRILRIILFIPVMSLCALFSIYFYRTQGYLHPIATYDEGFAITALFLLYVQYVCPHPNGRAQYFSNLERRWFNGKKKGTGGSLRWYRVCIDAVENQLSD